MFKLAVTNVAHLSPRTELCLKCIRNRGTFLRLYTSVYFTSNVQFQPKQNIHTVCILRQKQKTASGASLVPFDYFEKFQKKDREAFLDALGMFEQETVKRRGQVEFIYAALKYMEEFGVHKDLEVYKKLIDVFPKGKYIPTNIFQAEFMHYPKQQTCAIDVLEKMEHNGVMPDSELNQMLVNIFGKTGHPVRKMMRMAYWMPKFKNASPWALPNPIPNDSLELAILAMKRICSVDLQNEIEIYQASELEDAVDPTWIVGAQSPIQKELIEKHPKDKAIYVEGGFRLWLREASVNYFILRADPEKKPEPKYVDYDDVNNIKLWLFGEKPAEDLPMVKPSVHEQDDGTILAACATGTSSRDSLLSWIRFLERSNPRIGDIPVLFTLRSPIGDVVPLSGEETPRELGTDSDRISEKAEEKATSSSTSSSTRTM